MTHVDKFWKIFWFVFLFITAIFTLVTAELFYLYNPLRTADAASVGISYDPARDPFERMKRDKEVHPKFTGEYFYQDSLPLAFSDWSWSVETNWSSSEQYFEGTRAIKIQFLQEWAGARTNASDIDVSPYEGISLAVFPDQKVGDLYIELFDTYGRSLGRQSISWYTSAGSLNPSAWNVVSIQFANLFPLGQNGRTISGYSIGSDHPGVAYVDAIHLEKKVPQHARWKEPLPYQGEAPEKPATPIDLPYSLKFTPDALKSWRTIFGRFDLTNNGVRMGPSAQKTTGSMSYLRGGQLWRNYKVDTTTYWGPTESFSILVRYVDDANFISCAFGSYNATVSIYSVRKGVSTSMGSSPGLAVRADEPWKDAKAGASVNGNTVSCYVDGEKALSATIQDMPVSGSVGFETWTRNTYDQPHVLQMLNVTSL